MSLLTSPNSSVLLISHGFQRNYERGFCNGLASHDVDVLLVSSDTTDYSSLARNVKTVNLRGSQTTNRSRLTKLTNIAYYHLRLLLKVLTTSRRNVHVIGLIEPQILCGLFEGLWFRLFAQQYFLTVHDLIPHDKHTWLHKTLSRWSYGLPHRLVVHTRRMRDELASDFEVPYDKIVVMEHGIEPVKDELPLPLHVYSETLQLLFFGVVARYKGLDILLAALESFPVRFSLKIAGRCIDESLSKELERSIECHPFASSISWQNSFIAEKEIPRLFNEADALVLPYRHIDQSGVLFQALRFGTPILATRVGAFEDYITSNVGELCLPTRDSLREALIRVHARLVSLDRERIATIGKTFEWPTTVRPMVDSYV